MAIKIYVDYLSQPSRAVWAVCLLGGFPFEVVEKRLAKGEVPIIFDVAVLRGVQKD